MSIREISDKIYSNPEDRCRMEEMNEIYYEMADYIKENSPTAYEHFLEEAEEVLYTFTEAEATEIVRGMRPFGEHWTVSDVNNYVTNMGEEPSTDWYLAMNMAYNDYRRTATDFNVDSTEFYYSIARDFVQDEDGNSHKTCKYFKCVV